MSTDLTRIGEKARKEPHLVFTTLYHHVTDVDNLRACYDALSAAKATGVDRVSKEQYGKELAQNLEDLSGRLKEMRYRPQPKRRSYVPKPGSAKGRPLGISSFEDKLVELAVKRVLEPIYEQAFEDGSYGYRPDRSTHGCLDELGRTIQQERVQHVVEADIRSFFDRVNHEWMLKFLAHRIGDPRILRLIGRMLKAGVMEDGLVRASEEGTPQGSILSPLLSNIYLHYMRWICGSIGGSRSDAEAKRTIFVLPMIFWPVLSTNPMQWNSVSSWRTGCKDLVWNWRRKRHAVLNLAGMHGKKRVRRAKSPRSSPFWDSRTSVVRLARDTSN
jgi:hypothetical protein